MSEDKAQYDVFSGLLSGTQVHTLNAESMLEAIRDEAQERLGNVACVYVLHLAISRKIGDSQGEGRTLNLIKTT